MSNTVKLFESIQNHLNEAQDNEELSNDYISYFNEWVPYFNDNIYSIDLSSINLEKLNDYVKTEIEEKRKMFNLHNTAIEFNKNDAIGFSEWDNDFWLKRGTIPGKVFNTYSEALREKYNLNRNAGLFLSYCIYKICKENLFYNSEESESKHEPKEISRKSYDGDEYPATIIAKIINIDNEPYDDYITQVDEIKYDDGSIIYHYKTNHSDGSITKEELDNYKNTR